LRPGGWTPRGPAPAPWAARARGGTRPAGPRRRSERVIFRPPEGVATPVVRDDVDDAANLAANPVALPGAAAAGEPSVLDRRDAAGVVSQRVV
jgi:hypothetical protein